MKRVKVRIPSGRVVVRSKRRRVSKAVCANCKAELHGMPRLGATDFKISKTEKRPSRAYGGYFCGNCTKELLRQKARMM